MTKSSSCTAVVQSAGESLARVRTLDLRLGHWLLAVGVLAIFAFLFIPLVVVVGVSFNESASFAFPPDGFSLRWFERAFSAPDFRDAFVTSLQVSAATSLSGGVIGTAFALAATRRRDRVFGVTWLLAMTPILLPGVFIGVALFSAFTFTGIDMSLRTAVLGQLVYIVPFVILIADARLHDFDLTLEEAGRSLGYSRGATFAWVTLPIVFPSLLAAIVLSFAISFDEFFITFFVIGQDATLPIYILSRLRTGIDPGANAVATILLLVPLVLTMATVAAGLIRQRRHAA